MKGIWMGEMLTEYFEKYYSAEMALSQAAEEIKAAEQKKYNANSTMTKVKRDLLSNGLLKINDFKAEYSKWKEEYHS
jgi:hypothetical protein